jgi:hypothetical protein
MYVCMCLLVRVHKFIDAKSDAAQTLTHIGIAKLTKKPASEESSCCQICHSLSNNPPVEQGFLEGFGTNICL